MATITHELDRIAITVKSHMLLRQLLKENPTLEEIMRNARNETEALIGVRNWVLAACRTFATDTKKLSLWHGKIYRSK